MPAPGRRAGAPGPRGRRTSPRRGSPGARRWTGWSTVRLRRRHRGRLPPRGGLRPAAVPAPGRAGASTPSTRWAATTRWRRSAPPGCAAAGARCSPTSGCPTRAYWEAQAPARGAGGREGGRRDRRVQLHVAAARLDYLAREYGRTTAWSCPAGSTLDAFVPAPERASQRPTILFSGAFDEPHKEVPLLLEALPIVAESEPERAAVAERPGRRRARCSPRRPPRRASARSVLGLGEADRQHERYGRAWVTCLPSRYDSFGMVLVESLACGTPARDHHPGRAAGAGASRASPASCARPATPQDLARALPARARRWPASPRRSRPAARRPSASTGTAGLAPLCERLYAAADEQGAGHRRGRLRGQRPGARRWPAEGWEVRALVRERAPHLRRRADGGRPGAATPTPPSAACEGVDAVVHLAGRERGGGRARPRVRASAARCWPPSALVEAAGRRRRSGGWSTCRRSTSTAAG